MDRIPTLVDLSAEQAEPAVPPLPIGFADVEPRSDLTEWVDRFILVGGLMWLP